MKADEIRNLSDADLTARVGELQEEQFRLRFRSATETLEQPLRLRTIRRDIARILTVQRERALQQQSQAAGKSGASTKAAPQARRATRRSAKPNAAK